MKPKISIITIGVDDLERALTFYRDGLGFPTRGVVGTEFEHGAVAFFDLMNGLKLAIWGRKDLAHEAKVPLGLLQRFRWDILSEAKRKWMRSSLKRGAREPS
jgi:catechol 2,3-dioxygenase-like lactoylglutathione lyase family enzyme